MASLAPNCHNTRAWTFIPCPGGVSLAVDPARRSPVVAPYCHHLFVSLSCAGRCCTTLAGWTGPTSKPIPAQIPCRRADGPLNLLVASASTKFPGDCFAIPCRVTGRWHAEPVRHDRRT